MKKQSDDIGVFLTTTKYLRNSTMNIFQESNTRKLDIPVCVVRMGISIFGGAPIEHQEHCLAQTIIKMAEFVKVNLNKKSIYIGDNPKKPYSSLVFYQQTHKDRIYENHFFKRWKEVQKMLFEFQLHDLFRKQIIFTVKGYWEKEKWSKELQINYSPSLYTTEDVIYG